MDKTQKRNKTFSLRRQGFTERGKYEEKINDMKMHALKTGIMSPKYLCTISVEFRMLFVNNKVVYSFTNTYMPAW